MAAGVLGGGFCFRTVEGLRRSGIDGKRLRGTRLPQYHFPTVTALSGRRRRAGAGRVLFSEKNFILLGSDGAGERRKPSLLPVEQDLLGTPAAADPEWRGCQNIWPIWVCRSASNPKVGT